MDEDQHDHTGVTSPDPSPSNTSLMRLSPFLRPACLTLILTFITCLVLAPRRLLAAPEPPDTTPTPPPPVTSTPNSFPSLPTIEVEISPTIPDAQALSDWIHQASLEALSQLPFPPTTSGTIRVSISGELYDYDVSVAIIREGSTTEDTVTWPCECTNADLLARIQSHVRTAARAFGNLARPPEPPTAPSRPPSTLGREGKIGLGMLGGGAALTIVGLSLIAIGERGSAELHAGIPTLAVGVTAIGAGMALVIIDRRASARATHPRVAAFPLVTPRGAHLGFAIRF